MPELFTECASHETTLNNKQKTLTPSLCFSPTFAHQQDPQRQQPLCSKTLRGQTLIHNPARCVYSDAVLCALSVHLRLFNILGLDFMFWHFGICRFAVSSANFLLQWGHGTLVSSTGILGISGNSDSGTPFFIA